MARTTRRRVQFAAAATGILATGVMALPNLAGAQAHDGPDHDEPTTTVTTAPPASSSTTTSTTPPTTADPNDVTPPPAHDVTVNPGVSVTFRGSDCPGGTVDVVIANMKDIPGTAKLLPGSVKASPKGNWSYTLTAPQEAGQYIVAPGCTLKPGQDAKVLEDWAFFIFVVNPGQPTTVPPTTKPKPDPGKVYEAPPKGAKPVKTSPKFTG
jgi:hypothetical protein